MDRQTTGSSATPGSVVLGRYEILERLGSGGFGIVWRARDTVLQRDVALKHIALDRDDGAAREGRVLAHVSHPGVVAIHDMVVADEAVWLVLEYVPGSSLDLLIARDGRRAPAEVARLGVALAGALAHGHERGLVHRDVKPGNVLVVGDGAAVKLADYGIARLTGRGSPGAVTTSRQRQGSLPWASPEWARNEEITAASDVFSLGATLFHAVEGRPPFADEAPGRALVLEVAAGRVLPARHAGPLGEVLARMLDPDPGVRPEAADVAASLSTVAAAQDDHRTAEAPVVPAAGPPPPHAPPPHTPTPHAPPPGRPPRRWRVGLAVALVLVAVLVAGGLWAARPFEQPTEDPLTLPAAGLAPVLVVGDERDVDPCAVVDTGPLAVFGTPRSTPGPYLSACTTTLQRPGSPAGSSIVADVFRGSDSGEGDDRRPLGAGYVVRRPASEGCRATVTLTIDVSVALRTRSDDPAVDACRLVDAAVALTVRGLNAHGFVSRAGRTAGWPLAVVDACTLATRASLAPVGLAGQLDGPQSNGWGRWDCRWGRDVADVPVVELVLRLEDDNDVLGRGPRSLVAGRMLVTELGDGDQNPRLCTTALLWRPVERPAGLFQVVEARVEGPFDDARLCRTGQGLVTTAAGLLDERR